MRRKQNYFKNPIILFAAGFFIGLFIKFLPLFIIIMAFVLVAGGILNCLSS